MPDQQAGFPDDLIELGRITSAYGVQGWVKIQPYSTQPEALLGARTWWLKAPVPPLGGTGALACARRAAVLVCRPHAGTIVARLDICGDRDQAQALKAYTVCVPRADFPLADTDEYYWVDLIGCRLFGDDSGEPALIGQVIDVLDNGAHALLRVVRADIDGQGALAVLKNDKGRTIEVLVPFVNAHVQSVDLLGKRIDSNWPAEF